MAQAGLKENGIGLGRKHEKQVITFKAEVYSGVECGQSTGATYPCLMLSHTRL